MADGWVCEACEADACDHCTDTECTHDCEPGAGPTPRTAADVLREHHGRGLLFVSEQQCACGWEPDREAVRDKSAPFREQHTAHQAAMLAAAGLLATAEPVVMRVHYGDSEAHARSFYEGFETAVAQGLADDPAAAQDWLAEHDREVAAQALRDAAEAINHRDAETIRREAGAEVVNGPTRALDVIRWLRARADHIAAGEES